VPGRKGSGRLIGWQAAAAPTATAGWLGLYAVNQSIGRGRPDRHHPGWKPLQGFANDHVPGHQARAGSPDPLQGTVPTSAPSRA